MVYIWGRRNEHVRMSFLGLFPFNAPYLPWVLFAFSLILGNSATVDLIGIAVGHIYFYFDDIFPEVARIRGWAPKRYLRLSTYLPAQDEIQVDTAAPIGNRLGGPAAGVPPPEREDGQRPLVPPAQVDENNNNELVDEGRRQVPDTPPLQVDQDEQQEEKDDMVTTTTQPESLDEEERGGGGGGEGRPLSSAPSNMEEERLSEQHSFENQGIRQRNVMNSEADET